MDHGGGRKRRIVNDSNSSSKKTRQRKNNNNFSCETNQRFRHKSVNSCEHHVTNTSVLQGEQLRKEFVKKLIKPRAVNLWSRVTSSSRECDDKTDIYHHDNLYHNHLNMVQLLW